ncbi:MAG: S46 family peptidase, partial [Crocinitomicaceae bacterium]|nr:S46 family peptidase [Crocinitomicaceae bacterium]
PYSKNNVPYKPLFSLTIDAGKKKNGDFTMVYGFPGMTEQHLVSGQLKFIIDKVRPAQISMREKSLSIIDSRMRANDEIRIKYAAKQASIANSYKKWIGQIQGLKELRAVDVKHNYEANYTQTALQNEAWRDSYGTVVERMNMLFEQNKAIEFSNALYIEYLFVGPEFFKQVRVMDDLLKNYEKYEKSGDLKNRIDKNKKAVEKFFKDYSKEVDQTIFYLLHSEFLSQMEKSYLPDVIYSKSTEEWSRGIYEKSIFTDKQRLLDFYTKLSSKSIKKIKKDQGYILFTSLINKYRGDILPKLQDFQIGMEELLKTYVAGKQIMFPNEKHWPDANSTLRITYGKLEGSSPKDGMMYEDHTTIDGIIEKNKSGNPDFELLPRMFDLYNKKEFGPYAQDNELWVCFSASNHTTGGNSGSPVLNENGQLIGINFDRTWESTMSDYMFDPSRCRNVVCDIRYVLWVIDIYSNANHLIKEMNIIRD